MSGRVARLDRRVHVWMKLASLKSSGPISVLLFSQNFKTECDSNNNRKSSATLFFSQLILYPCKAALSHKMTSNNKKDKWEEAKLSNKP